MQVQNKFWLDGINTILNSVSDPDFTTTFINFLHLLNLENISPQEKEIIFNNALAENSVTKGS